MGEMASFTANSPADILSETRQIFHDGSNKMLRAVHDEWITWLEWITTCKGEYNHIQSKKSSTL
jgi:hypothetical protein